MGLWKRYLNAFARELGLVAVWEPGSHFALGDYGSFNGKHFSRLGSVFDEFDFSAEAAECLQPTFFSGARVLTGESSFQLQAQARTSELAASCSAKLLRSLVVVERDVEILQLKSPRKFAEELAGHAGVEWFKDKLVVHKVHRADTFHVVLSRVAGAGVEVDASCEMLAALAKGLRIDGTLNVPSGEGVWDRSGPMSIGLVGYPKWYEPWLPKAPRTLGASGSHDDEPQELDAAGLLRAWRIHEDDQGNPS